ncbi:MAG: hypothetical protein ACRDSJ_24305 [Rubrobacteraceae bacterium]
MPEVVRLTPEKGGKRELPAVEPTGGESFSLYLPGMDGKRFERFLRELSRVRADRHVPLVLDNARAALPGESSIPRT